MGYPTTSAAARENFREMPPFPGSERCWQQSAAQIEIQHSG